MKPSKTDAIILCPERLGHLASERMFESTEAHLPFTNNKEVYEIFVQEFNVLSWSETDATFLTFISVWKH